MIKKLEENNSTIQETNEAENINNDSNSVVLYFSATGTTKNVAEKIAELSNSNIQEIVPKEKYTTEDLSYSNECRANKEQQDKDARQD